MVCYTLGSHLSKGICQANKAEDSRKGYMQRITFPAVTMIVAMLTGCGTMPRRQYLEKLNLDGQHELSRIEHGNGLHGYFSGGFLTGTSGRVNAGTELRFFWRSQPNEFTATTFPYEKFKFVG